MFKHTAPLLLTVALAGAASTAIVAPAGAASKPECGLGPSAGSMDGHPVYLTRITKLTKVSCATAKKVAKGVTEEQLCKKSTTMRGWKMRNINPGFFVSRYSKGGASFVVTGQGAC